MWKRLSDRLYQVINGRVALAATAILLLFVAFVLPVQSARMEASANSGGSPDTSLFYSTADLYTMAETHGPEGRPGYVQTTFTFDLAFPLVYTFFFISVISWVYKRICTPGSRVLLLNLVPILGMLFDYLENLGASMVMLRYPAHTAVVDVLTPVFSLIKWVFTGGSFLILMAGMVWVVVSRLKSLKNPSHR
jgi:hypothetical protein